MKLATFAAGCFWGAEESYRTLKGVAATAVGYMDRAEVVRVTYNPAQISYEQLLDVFWGSHNPTIPNPGGLERSAIFYHDPGQRLAIEKSKQAVQGRFHKPIATEIAPAVEFHLAAEDQQHYLFKRGLAACEVQPTTEH